MEQNANIASLLDDTEAKKVARVTVQGFEVDNDSRADWLNKHNEYLKLYHQQDTQVESVFPETADVSIPLLAEAVNAFQARAYKAFFPNRQFLNAIPEQSNNREAMAAAERVGKHMNWQLTIKDRSYRSVKNDMFQAVAIHGSDFTKVYHDPIRKMNVVERVRAEDLVIPYGYGARELKDIERKTHIIYMSMNKAKKYVRDGYFTQEPVPMPMTDSLNDIMKRSQDEAEGLQNPSELISTCKIYEQHTFFDLDDDGIAEPYIQTICGVSHKLLRMVPRYEVDANGNPTNDFEPEEYFVHYGCLPNPDGFYRNGYGHILAKLNRACNGMLRQIVEAGGLANVGNMGGFMSDKLGIEGDEHEIQIGKFTKVPITSDDIRKHLYQMQFPGPSPALYNTLQYLEGITRRIGSTTDPVTGNVDKVLQPLTIMTLLDSALQMPTSIMETLALSFEHELELLYKLNRKYLNEKDYFYDGTQTNVITPQDYQNKFRIVPILDPRSITKQQKVAKAQETYQFVMNNPDLNQNPNIRHEATQRMLDAMEVEDAEKINPPLPEPPKTEKIDDQELENMYFMLPKAERPMFDVFPDQDHVEHIDDIDKFISLLTGNYLEGNTLEASKEQGIDVIIQTMTDELKRAIVQELQIHKTKHLAYLYGLTTGVIDGQGKPTSMEAQSGNQMDAAGILQAIQSAPTPPNMSIGQGGALQGATGSAGIPPEVADQQGILGLATLDYNQER